MRRFLVSAPLLILSLCFASIASAEYPKPSIYPLSWELKFEHGVPQRIVVQVPGRNDPQAFWYVTYTVTNKTDKEQLFLPVFEMLTDDGKVIRSDKNIPLKVFEAIKQREKKALLEPEARLAGEIRLGEDQARDGVAIWPETTPRMGKFSIFISGLSGESVVLEDDAGNPVKNEDGQPTILRKTLQLSYHIRGDEVFPGEDEVNTLPERWVMR